MASAEWLIQKAVYGVLIADSGIQAQVGSTARVYDHVPQGSTFPYITLGVGIAIDESTFSKFGQVHTIDIDCWSRYRGFQEIKDIMTAVNDALHEAVLTAAGFVVAGIIQTFSQAINDPDGLTRHGIQRFDVTVFES